MARANRRWSGLPPPTRTIPNASRPGPGFTVSVESLNDEDREVFDLLWYQGLTQGEAAEVLGLSEKTVNRRWVAARMRLGMALGGQLPF